jgi:hypothetical protein
MMKLCAYHLYHLNVASEIPFPELPPAHGSIDVVIQMRCLNAPASADEARRQGIRTNATQVNLFFAGFGALSVRGGTRIVVDPLPAASEQAIHVLVLDFAMAVLLQQRGLVVLHGSAVHDGRSAEVFVGDQGWGKSTMAAALRECGFGVATDDIAAIEVAGSHPPLLWPSFPQLKLWPDSLRSLAQDPSSLPLAWPGFDKRIQALKDTFRRKPVPVSRVYVLGQAKAPSTERLEPQQAFAHLLRHQYLIVPDLLKLTGQSAHGLSAIARLIEQVPVFRLLRPASLATICETANWVKRHIQSPEPVMI